MNLIHTVQHVNDLMAMVTIMHELSTCQTSQNQLEILRRCLVVSGDLYAERAVEFINVQMLIMKDNQPMIKFTYLYEVDRGEVYKDDFYFKIVDGINLGSHNIDFV